MAQSSVIGTAPTTAALEQTLQLGSGRIRAFLGGVVTSSGLTLFFDHWGRDVVLVVAAAICITIAVWPVRPTRLWYSPYLTGLGLGLLLTGTFLWFRPHDTGATAQWLIAVAVGSLLFWSLPGRHGRPTFLLTMLVAAMVGVAVWGADTTIDGSDYVVLRFIDSIEPSVVTLIVVAFVYTLCGIVLDRSENRSGAAGTVLAAAIVGASWALMIAVRAPQRDVLGALLVTGVLLTIAGYLANRQIVGGVGMLIAGVAAVRLYYAAEVSDHVGTPNLPISLYIGVVLILFGVLLGRGVHGE